MNSRKPKFRLEAVLDNRHRGEPELVPVNKLPWMTNMGRRGALGTGLGFAGVLAAFRRAVAGEIRMPEDAICTVPSNLLSAHRLPVRTLALTPDEKLLASGVPTICSSCGQYPRASFWKTLTDHRATVSASAITADGKRLISASVDGAIRIWSLPGGALLSKLGGAANYVRALALSPDKATQAAGGSGGVEIWSIERQKLAGSFATDSPSSQAACTSLWRF